MRNKSEKLCILALGIALCAFALPAATEQIYNFIGTENINITHDGYNVTISADFNVSNKVNKTGDTMSGSLQYIGSNYISGVHFAQTVTLHSLHSLSGNYSEVAVSPLGVKIMSTNTTEVTNTIEVFPYYTRLLKYLDMNYNKIINVALPVNDNDAANKQYVDQFNDLKVNKTGDNMTGGLNVAGNISSTNFYARKVGINTPNFTDGTVDGAITIAGLSVFPPTASTAPLVIGMVDDSLYTLPMLLFRRSGGAWDGYNATPTNTTNQHQLGGIMITGYAGGWTGTKASLQWFSDGNWNATSTPVYLRFQTYGLSGAHQWYLREGVFYPQSNLTQDLGKSSNQFGNVYAQNATLSGLSGVGNDYACLNAAGTLYRSNTAC